ncbi:reverse transcriptase domain protein [Metarhizium robertsii]|uniref:Reverse transcriptase domain protein n=1 Tax=Metarhizium robertsii TaxID=568076 RepID=A0A014N4M3_9HYPO|nr:reverse transcriptase domain protein [Metarhizium robertsii]
MKHFSILFTACTALAIAVPAINQQAKGVGEPCLTELTPCGDGLWCKPNVDTPTNNFGQKGTCQPRKQQTEQSEQSEQPEQPKGFWIFVREQSSLLSIYSVDSAETSHPSHSADLENDASRCHAPRKRHTAGCQLLEARRIRFSARIKSLDPAHPLVKRTIEAEPLPIIKGIKLKYQLPEKPFPTRLRRTDNLLPRCQRPVLLPRKYASEPLPPLQTAAKKEAAEGFNAWLESVSPLTVIVYSDGSLSEKGAAGYGFTIHQNGRSLRQGAGRLGPAEVFDAEVRGALDGLKAALRLPQSASQKIVVCLDNIAAAGCLRGQPSDSSQGVFLAFQALAKRHRQTDIRWIPGHSNIAGNEQADVLAKVGCTHPEPMNAAPTLAFLRRGAKRQCKDVARAWWNETAPDKYRSLNLDFPNCCPPELDLPRPVLHHLLAARNHRDFADYHERFGHDDAKLTCSSSWRKSPTHLFYCRKVDPRHRMRLAPSPVVAIDRAIGRDFEKFVKLAQTAEWAFTGPWWCVHVTPWLGHIHAQNKCGTESYNYLTINTHNTSPAFIHKDPSSHAGDLRTNFHVHAKFSSKGLRILLLDWVTYHNLPFDIVNTERFQRILLYGNPLLDVAHIPSAKTLFRMLESEYRGAVGPVTEILNCARSQIHFSFDGWTSKTYTSFLGINAQFIDRSFVQHRILLGFRPLSGRHNGASLADEVADTLAFWQINDPDKLGYFTLDNATNNDTCMEELAFEHNFSSEERRIRCGPHVINLSVRDLLYGSKRENFAAIVAADGDDQDEDEHIDHAIDEALNGETDYEDVEMQADAVVDPDEDFTSSHPAPEEINETNFREYSPGLEIDRTDRF